MKDRRRLMKIPAIIAALAVVLWIMWFFFVPVRDKGFPMHHRLSTSIENIAGAVIHG